VTPLLNTPAYRAGIKPGDLIVAVNGRTTEDLSIDKLVQMIMGETGTKVVLRIKRPGLLEPKDFEIVREEIHIRTVKGWSRESGGQWDYLLDPAAKIAYVRIEQFTEDTHDDVVEALRQMRAVAGGSLSLVLDLRANPGGLLREAARLVNEFLRAGVIVSTGPPDEPNSASVMNARDYGEFLHGDVVVLVNWTSASAAEIVSGALKDHHRAIIVGERTYGKASVQKVIKITDHEALLKLTTAYYKLPSGTQIHRENGKPDWGVDPDVTVRATPKQLRRWNAVRRKIEVIQDLDPDEARQDVIRQYETDMPLQTAILLLKLKGVQRGHVLAAGT
jgi:carboxyl-terminal processing protease